MSDSKIKLSNGLPLSLSQRYLERALDFYGKKKYSQALADLDEAIRADKRNAELYATRGLILIQTGETEEGLVDVAHALKIDPSQWVAYYAQALQAYESQKYAEALQYLRLAQRYSPLRPEIYIYMAAAHYQAGDKSAAEREIDSALQVLQAKDKLTSFARKWKKLIKG